VPSTARTRSSPAPPKLYAVKPVPVVVPALARLPVNSVLSQVDPAHLASAVRFCPVGQSAEFAAALLSALWPAAQVCDTGVFVGGAVGHAGRVESSGHGSQVGAAVGLVASQQLPLAAKSLCVQVVFEQSTVAKSEMLTEPAAHVNVAEPAWHVAACEVEAIPATIIAMSAKRDIYTKSRGFTKGWCE